MTHNCVTFVKGLPVLYAFVLLLGRHCQYDTHLRFFCEWIAGMTHIDITFVKVLSVCYTFALLL